MFHLAFVPFRKKNKDIFTLRERNIKDNISFDD